MQWEITSDFILILTGFWLWELLCSLIGFFWTIFNLLARLYFLALMISRIDVSAKCGLSGSSLIELELSWLKRSQSSIFSKLISWIINLVVLWSFSMVIVFYLCLNSLSFAISLISIFVSPFCWARSYALSSWFCLLEMLSIIYWLTISLSIPYRMRYTYSMFMAEFRKLQMLASFSCCLSLRCRPDPFLEGNFLHPLLIKPASLSTLDLKLFQTNGSLSRIRAEGIPMTCMYIEISRMVFFDKLFTFDNKLES